MIIKSLWKALDVLEYFSPDHPEAGILEISEALGLTQSNVCDIVKTFEKRGYLQQNKQSKKYHLGFRVLQLYYAFNYNDAANEIIRPHLKAIAQQTGELVYYGTIYAGKVLYLAQADPDLDSFYVKRTAIGSTAPLYCTGLGKALLAHQSEAFIESIIAEGLEPITGDTICDETVLRRELERIRQQGYSIDNMEHELGVRCVGVPLLNQRGEALGAISVTGPSLRFNQERTAQFANILKQHVGEIQKQMFL